MTARRRRHVTLASGAGFGHFGDSIMQLMSGKDRGFYTSRNRIDNLLLSWITPLFCYDNGSGRGPD